MDIDPRLAGPSAGSKTPSFVGHVVTGSVGALPPAALSTPTTHRPLGFLPTAPPHLTPIQSALPTIFTTPSPASTSAASAAPLLDQKRPRACESCRGLKVRCEPNEHNPFATCKRCAKANRECIFTAPSRKRQKKSDSKVAELEKKIDALTASLRAQQAKAAHGDDDDDEDDYLDDGDMPGSDSLRPDAADFSPGAGRVKRRRSDDDGRAKGDSYQFHAPKAGNMQTPLHGRQTDGEEEKYVYVDVVDRGLLSMETATGIFNHYVKDMVPHFPAVVFPAGTTAEDVWQRKPTLFLAILAAASGTSDPELHRALYKEISRNFAERVMFNGEKSLELVQALILCTMWYFVPDNFEELKFYMYIHQAAVMALDIGITRKEKKTRGSIRGLPPLPTRDKPTLAPFGIDDHQENGGGPPGLGGDHPFPKSFPPPAPPMLRVPPPDPGAIESRRTLLACYWTACNVSMATRRPNLLRYTKFMDECVEVLESSPEAAPSDKVLCQWVKLQKIAEEIGIGFAFDDPNANVSIDDMRVQFSLKGFAKQLEEWKSKCPREALGASLELAYNVIMIYAHEIALHRDHNIDDFQPPYTESMMREPSIRPNELLSSFHIDAISRCLSSSHKVLEIFTSMPIPAICSVPVFTFVRTSYACVILIKLYFSASHPQSELGKVIDKNSLHVDEHIDLLLSTLKKAADGEASRQAGRFTLILTMLGLWYRKQKSEIERTDIMEPTDSFKKLGLAETSGGEMEGMETPNSMVDRATPERFDDSMRPPPAPRSTSLGDATPLQMLSNAALGSHGGQGKGQYRMPSPAPSMEMATSRSTPQASFMGKWGYPVDGTSMMDGGGKQTGHNHGGGGYELGGNHHGMEGGMGVGVGGGEYVPQYVFTGNEGMFMDDTFWTMMDGPNMFDIGGVKF